MSKRTYSKTDAQQRTIGGLFAIMMTENPRAAELLVIRLQQFIRARMSRGCNAG